ncbi:hypothetical protein AB4Z01_24880 [Inquilinus sp. YAF38]|uniref:hypothetical protein n=1 Tax=Inquilinus sp. YAF38 TaxID=3233084 RepID=UPI003F8F4571
MLAIARASNRWQRAMAASPQLSLDLVAGHTDSDAIDLALERAVELHAIDHRAIAAENDGDAQTSELLKWNRVSLKARS